MALEARLKASQQSCDSPRRENTDCQPSPHVPAPSPAWRGETVHATVTTVKVRFADESLCRDVTLE